MRTAVRNRERPEFARAVHTHAVLQRVVWPSQGT